MEARKVKEEPQASTSFADPKFDSLMKVMEKLVDRLSIDNKQSSRDNETQIRNPNFRQPRQPGPPPPQIAQRGQRLPNNNNNDQIRPPFQ